MPSPIPIESKYSVHNHYVEKMFPIPPRHELEFDHNMSINRRVFLWRGDMTRLAATAVVNAANNSLQGGGGIDGAIHKAAGPRLLAFNKTLGGCETGDAKIAPGFNLPAQFVIHTAGPIYNEYEDPQEAEEDLEDCYTACLERAIEINENAGKTEEGVESIAFCGISTGIYGFPLGKATHIALRTVRSFLENHPKQELVKNIVFVCFPLRDYEVYKTLIPVYFPPTHPGRKDDEQFIPEEEAFVPKEIAFPKPEDVFLPNSVLRMSRQIESGEKKKWDDFDI